MTLITPSFLFSFFKGNIWPWSPLPFSFCLKQGEIWPWSPRPFIFLKKEKIWPWSPLLFLFFFQTRKRYDFSNKEEVWPWSPIPLFFWEKRGGMTMVTPSFLFFFWKRKRYDHSHPFLSFACLIKGEIWPWPPLLSLLFFKEKDGYCHDRPFLSLLFLKKGRYDHGQPFRSLLCLKTSMVIAMVTPSFLFLFEKGKIWPRSPLPFSSLFKEKDCYGHDHPFLSFICLKKRGGSFPREGSDMEPLARFLCAWLPPSCDYDHTLISFLRERDWQGSWPHTSFM